MKTIKIKFVNFWNNPKITPESYPFKEILEKRYDVVFSDKPDYLFFSVLDRKHPFEYAKYDCVRIFYTGENFSPDFTVADYAIGFDYITFDDRYIRYPQLIWTGIDLNELAVKNTHIPDDILRTKEYFCNFIYSNSRCCPERKAIFDSLNSYKTVTSPGKYLNNTVSALLDDKGGYQFSNAKYEFMRKCKFTIACENYSHKGYLTEKLFHAFVADTIPIYFGDTTVTNTINPESFINIRDFSSIDSAVDYVKKIDNDDDLYLSILRKNIFLSKNYVKESYKKISDFLYNIFDQELNAAFRRQRVMHSLYHEKCLLEYNRLVTNFWVRALNKFLKIF